MKLTKEDFYKDSASQGIWFYKSREFTEKEINEIITAVEHLNSCHLAIMLGEVKPLQESSK